MSKNISNSRVVRMRPRARTIALISKGLISDKPVDWSLESIHQFAWNEFAKVHSWEKRMNAWYVAISRRTLGAAHGFTHRPVRRYQPQIDQSNGTWR
jgi:hypothetical protein